MQNIRLLDYLDEDARFYPKGKNMRQAQQRIRDFTGLKCFQRGSRLNIMIAEDDLRRRSERSSSL